jgi:hypothetical protein
MKNKIFTAKIFGKFLLVLLKPFFIYCKKENKWHVLYETNFAKNYCKSNLLQKSKSKNAKFITICKGSYEYGYFNFTFLDNMLSSVISVLSQGKFPIVDLDGRNENWTNWDTFFLQPIPNMLINVNGGGQKLTFEIKSGYFTSKFTTPFDENELKLWRKIYRDFAVLNADTQQYVDNEFETLLKGKRVLGILCRGTDYVQKRPYGHPVQPETADVIALAKEKMTELDLDYIYLATEEKRIENQFNEAFPNKIITNRRTYYDEMFYNKQMTEIYQVFDDRKSAIYTDGLQYLSSVYLLSKCDAFVGGNCGGSTSALYLNDGKYKYWYLFNLGFYGK